MIKAAGKFLLSILAAESTVRYSRFYGTREARLDLREGLAISESDADWYSAESLMDDAVVLFEHHGFVETAKLNSRLIDGSPDYEIRLTENGRMFIASGVDFEFPDLDYHI